MNYRLISTSQANTLFRRLFFGVSKLFQRFFFGGASGKYHEDQSASSVQKALGSIHPFHTQHQLILSIHSTNTGLKKQHRTRQQSIS